MDGKFMEEISKGVGESWLAMGVAEVAEDGKKVQAEIVRQRKELESLSGKCRFAVTTVGPDFMVEKLWLGEEFTNTGVAVDRLRILDAIWWALTDEARKRLGTAGISSEMAKVGKDDRLRLEPAAREALVAIFSVGAIDLSPQETDELKYAGGQIYWESVVALAVKMGVRDFSLHLPFLRNLNLSDGKQGLYNFETMLISGHLTYYDINKLGERSGILNADVMVEKEAIIRARETVAAAKEQIDWFRRMKDKYKLNQERKNNITVHLSAVGMHHRLSSSEFGRAMSNLAELQAYAGDDFVLLVETQGMEVTQIDAMLEKYPDIRLVFDIAHVAIEGERYGEIMGALEKYKDRIGVIHFAQPTVVDGRIVDSHRAVSAEGFYTDDQKKKIIKFAKKNGIWMTFESDFFNRDLDYLKNALSEEA